MTTSPGKYIGLFGGSFNPLHDGHLLAAETAHDLLKTDEIWLLVTPQNPLKDPLNYAPLENRMAMGHLLAQDKPWLVPSDIEKNFNSTITADNLKKIAALYPQHRFVWIMGADNLRDFHMWEDWQDIIDTWPVAVLHRQGDKDTALDSPAARYAAHLKTDDPASLGRGGPGWCFINSPDSGLKSRAVVERIRKGPISLSALFNELAGERKSPEFRAIARYIMDGKLYGCIPAPEPCLSSRPASPMI